MNHFLDRNYWNTRYKEEATGWDIGYVSTPLKSYIDQLSDKNTSILVPGCGNAYEAKYLIESGFMDITLIDIAPSLTLKLEQEIGGFCTVITEDFFKLKGSFDLILEQTFFCALDPLLREQYVEKVHELLNAGGKLVGVLFDKEFEHEGPPFGGMKEEYEKLFASKFHIEVMEECYNSIEPRKGSELFVILSKK